MNDVSGLMQGLEGGKEKISNFLSNNREIIRQPVSEGRIECIMHFKSLTEIKSSEKK